MKALTITYRVITALIALMMVFSAYQYIANPALAAAFHHLGFPDYFRIELAIAKTIGAIVLLAPVAARVKEWAYSGFFIVFVSAFIAHTASGDPAANKVGPVIGLVLLIVSYITWQRTRQALPAGKV